MSGAKDVLRALYRGTLGVHSALGSARKGAPGGTPRLFYGGARPGDDGGPKVKIKKLNEAFPERWWGYNLVYLLSNAPYLTAAALGRLDAKGIPVVLNQNGVFYPAWYKGDWEAENRRMATGFHAARHVFFQSAFCRRSAEKFLGLRQGPGEILYNAVDTNRFVPGNRHWQEGKPFDLLLAGKVQPHQAYRLEASIEGVAAARRQGLDVRLKVAGLIAPEAVERGRTLAAKLGVAAMVSFLGPYRQETAQQVFAGADAYIMTNHNDACPSTVIEAMACGLPVLYAESGGVPELVGTEAGVGVETGESWEEALCPKGADLGEGLLRLAENHAAFAAAARVRAVDRFDLAPWLDRHRALFAELLGGADG